MVYDKGVVVLSRRINAKNNTSLITFDNLHLYFIDEVREVRGIGGTPFQTISVDVIGPIYKLAIRPINSGFLPVVSFAVILQRIIEYWKLVLWRVSNR